MTKTELILILEKLAKKDLRLSSSLEDHPCSVAIRVIISLTDEVIDLARCIDGRTDKNDSKVQTVLTRLDNTQY